MSSLLSSGGGRAISLESLGLEVIKSPSTSWISSSSSPSSTLSESSNSPLTISTRKTRTSRKRPNQRYSEAAALLSTAYPKIFQTKHLVKSTGKNKNGRTVLFEPQDLLISLLHSPLLETSHFSQDSKVFNSFEKPCFSPGEINSRGDSSEVSDEYREDFDAESILDGEIGEGIDSIMGNTTLESERDTISTTNNKPSTNNFCYGYPIGPGFEYGYGMRSGARAIRNAQVNYPCLSFVDVTTKTSKTPCEKKTKTAESKTIPDSKTSNCKGGKGNPAPKSTVPEEPPPPREAKLSLKLNYDKVLSEWSDKGSPFPSDAPGAESAGNDVHARLAQIDLFSENSGMREASVQRYKEKRRTRLFSKKIRYQVRKVNADRRPRIKGRFVRTPNSPEE